MRSRDHTGRRPPAAPWSVPALLGLVGCADPVASQIGAFDDPSATATAAIAQLDSDSSGALDQSELQAAPGLLSGAARIDADRDGSITSEELTARFTQLGRMSSMVGVALHVTKAGEPLVDANVAFDPEAYLGGGRQRYVGVSDASGAVWLDGETVSTPGVPTGYYTVVITGDSVGQETRRGCEIADDASGTRVTIDL